MALTVNGTAVQTQQIRGPVGYTVVGSPTIVDGIASGFSSSNYLRINNFKDSGASCELNFTFTTPPSAANSCLFYATYFRAIFAYNGTRLNVVFNSVGSQETGYIDYTFDYGTKYTVNILRNGTTAFVKIYKGTTLEKEVEMPNISAFNNGNSTTMSMGYENVIFAAPFSGSIDLNETYIKVDGKLWFYQPQSTKYIIKDGKLVWADSSLYLRRPLLCNAQIMLGLASVTQDTEFEFVFRRNSSQDATSYGYAIIGGMAQTGAEVFIAFSSYGRDAYAKFGNLSTMYTLNISGVGTKYKCVLNKNGFYANDVLIRSNTTDNFEVTTAQNFVFEAKSADALELDLFYLNVRQSGILIRNFVPVKEGMTIGNYTVPYDGLFDIVTQTMAIKNGTGTFRVGRDA